MNINNINVSAIKTNSVVVSWDSTVAGTSQIEYGTTVYYGSITNEDSLSYFHIQTLIGLFTGTLYHYCIHSKEYDGAETISPGYTFTTRTQAELEVVVKAARADGGLPKTYYVKTDGNNANDGLTIVTAWQTPSYAVSKTDAGDTVYLLNGTWSGEQIVFPKSGIDVAPITLTKYNGTVILNGTNYDTGQAININFKDYIKIDNLIVRGYWGGITGVGSYNNISDMDVGYLAMGALGVSGDGYSASTGKALHDVWIQRNKFHDIAQTNDPGPNMVQFQGANPNVGRPAAYNIYFIDNEVYGKSLHEYIDIMSFSPGDPTGEDYLKFTGVGLRNLVLRGNYIHDIVSGVGVFSHYGVLYNFTFENNIISNTASHGMYVFIRDSFIRNNQFSNIKGYDFYTSDPGSANTIYENNTFTNIHLVGSNNTIIRNNLTGVYRLDYTGTVTDPIGSNFQLETTGNTAAVEFTDDKVFTLALTWGNGVNIITGPKYYSTKSNASLSNSASGARMRVTTYPMTARPASDPATVTVNKFDTTLVKGSVLVDFSADTANGNNVDFTVSTLKPNTNYLIKKGGVDFTTVLANASGTIAFSNFEWSARAFTIVEGNSACTPVICGFTII